MKDFGRSGETTLAIRSRPPTGAGQIFGPNIWDQYWNQHQNAITGSKSTKINWYLTRWGCTSIVIGTNEINFNIALWDAVRSIEFWDATTVQLDQCIFTLNSYSGQTGIANITVSHPESFQYTAAQKIVERSGVVSSSVATSTTFTLDRIQMLRHSKKIWSKSRSYLYVPAFRFNTATMDAAVAAGGVLELTKSQLLSAIIDMAAE